jgi:hypothetical protein
MEVESSYEETRRLNMLANEEMMGQLGLSAGAKGDPHGTVGGGAAEPQESAAAMEAVSLNLCSLGVLALVRAGGGGSTTPLPCMQPDFKSPSGSRTRKPCRLPLCSLKRHHWCL